MILKFELLILEGHFRQKYLHFSFLIFLRHLIWWTRPKIESDCHCIAPPSTELQSILVGHHQSKSMIRDLNTGYDKTKRKMKSGKRIFIAEINLPNLIKIIKTVCVRNKFSFFVAFIPLEIVNPVRFRGFCRIWYFNLNSKTFISR